jgi:hypothetical protein
MVKEIKMNKERLLALADYLDGVKRSKFNLLSWYRLYDIDLDKSIDKNNVAEVKMTKEEKKYADEGDKFFVVKEGFCKTTACALGHAAFNEDFNAQGLRVKFSAFEHCGKIEPGDAWVEYQPKKNGKVYVDFEAGQRFFGLSQLHASVLFGPGGSIQRQLADVVDSDKITPKKYAKVIRKYVETNGESLETILKEND